MSAWAGYSGFASARFDVAHEQDARRTEIEAAFQRGVSQSSSDRN